MGPRQNAVAFGFPLNAMGVYRGTEGDRVFAVTIGEVIADRGLRA